MTVLTLIPPIVSWVGVRQNVNHTQIYILDLEGRHFLVKKINEAKLFVAMDFNKSSQLEPFPVTCQQKQFGKYDPSDSQELDVKFDCNTFDAVNNILEKTTATNSLVSKYRSSGGLGNKVIRTMY